MTITNIGHVEAGDDTIDSAPTRAGKAPPTSDLRSIPSGLVDDVFLHVSTG